MSKAQLVIAAVVLEGRSKSEVAQDYDVSRQWVQQLCKRYEADGDAAYLARSRRPHHSPQAVTVEVEDRIVRLRKTLTKRGLDAGADTIASHLGARSRHHECACRLDNLANLKASWLRHTPTAQTAPLLLETLLRRTAQPMLASRRHPLAPRGQLIRKLVLDPTRDYQPRGVKCGNSPRKQAITV